VLTIPHFTFSDRKVYLSVLSTTDQTIQATMSVADRYNDMLSDDTTWTTRTCPGHTVGPPIVECSGHGTCIDPCNQEMIELGTCAEEAYCLCDDGFVHGSDQDCSVDAFGGFLAPEIGTVEQPGVRIPVVWKNLANPGLPEKKYFSGSEALPIPYEVYSAPPYSIVRIYVDGKAYPNNSSNTVVLGSGTSVSGEDTYFSVSVFNQEPLVDHKITVNLISDSGVMLGTDTANFNVGQIGTGCSNGCGEKGVCHNDYCVCYDGFAGEDCDQTVDEFMTTAEFLTADIKEGSWETSTAFSAGHAYEAAVQARNTMKVEENMYKESIQTAAMKARVKRSDDEMELSATATKNTLNSHLASTAAVVLEAKTALSEDAQTLWRKLDRKAVQIEQAAETSARMRTNNLEAHIDMQRSLYAHQTEMQNKYDGQIRDVVVHRARKLDELKEQMAEKDFILNTLKTSNGPRVQIEKLTETICVTDQQMGVTCTEQPLSTSFPTAAGYKTTGEVTNMPAAARPQAQNVGIENVEERGMYDSIPRGR